MIIQLLFISYFYKRILKVFNDYIQFFYNNQLQVPPLGERKSNEYLLNDYSNKENIILIYLLNIKCNFVIGNKKRDKNASQPDGPVVFSGSPKFDSNYS